MSEFPLRDVLLKQKTYSLSNISKLEETRDTLQLMYVFSKREKPKFTLLVPSHILAHTQEFTNKSSYIIHLLSQHLMTLIHLDLSSTLADMEQFSESSRQLMETFFQLNQFVQEANPLTMQFNLLFDPKIYSTFYTFGKSSPFTAINIHFLGSATLFSLPSSNDSALILFQEIIIYSLDLLTFLLSFSLEMIESDLSHVLRGQYAHTLISSILNSYLLEILSIVLHISTDVSFVEDLHPGVTIEDSRPLPGLPSVSTSILSKSLIFLGTLLHSSLLVDRLGPSTCFQLDSIVPVPPSFIFNVVHARPFEFHAPLTEILQRSFGTLSKHSINKLISHMESFLVSDSSELCQAAIDSLCLSGSNFGFSTVHLLSTSNFLNSLFRSYSSIRTDSESCRDHATSFLVASTSILYTTSNHPKLTTKIRNTNLISSIPTLLRTIRTEKHIIFKSRLIYTLAHLLFVCRSTSLLQTFGMVHYFLRLCTHSLSLTFSIQLTASCIYLLSILTIQESLVNELVSLGAIDILLSTLDSWVPGNFFEDIIPSILITKSWKKFQNIVLLYSLCSLINIISSNNFPYRQHLFLSANKMNSISRLLKHPNTDIVDTCSHLISLVKGK